MNDRRQAKREAAARAMAAKEAAARRRRVRVIGLGAAAALVVVVGIVLLVRTGTDETTQATTAPSAAVQDQDPALGTKPTVTAGTGTVSELTVTPIITGTGPKTTAGQRITVHYVGVTYATGAEFDASWKRGQPFSFELGAGNVIKGWDQGLIGVPVGSRVQLDIPSNLAYGDDANSGRPTGTLRFVVDVLKAE